MAETLKGKLVWQTTKSGRERRLIFPTKKGMSIPTPFNPAQLAPSLQNRTEEEIEVDLELMSGKPVRIRPVGEAFASAPAPALARPPHQGQHRGGNQPQGQGSGRSQSPPAFHNPYNFIPALPRDAVTGDLGDHEPAGHHAYHADRFSGVIRIKITVKTPLLLSDAARTVEYDQDQPAHGIKKGHKSLPVRVDADGKPYIPPTSIKGMLRSAFEAVTNSRMAVFAGHADRLADRMPARDGLSLVPARIVAANGVETIELLPGDSGISGSGQPSSNDPMYAAWLPRYDRQSGQVAGFAVRYPDNALPQHGEAVEAWLELWEKTGQYPFKYWSVRKCVRSGQPLGEPPHAGQRRGAHQPVPNKAMISARGYVCITNRNIDRKHDERVFFTTRDAAEYYPLTEGLRSQWRELIANYQTIHEAERHAGMSGPPALNNSVWSRHVVGSSEERVLTVGTLCFATFRDGQVTALYPVMISRRLFESSPQSLLPASLHPATGLTSLSPAERVFGWVNQRGKGACRSNLRVGPVVCDSDDAIEDFGTPGIPLAILGQPKPQQARFYVAASQNGEAQADGLSKERAGYSPGKGLRGRKVYPHHRVLQEQEYSRPQLNGQEQRDNQNRSIQGWVKPGTGFTFDLHVTNLSRVELGALVWLLNLPEEHYHRLGGGKPLGFGSVRLETDPASTQLCDGNGWRQIYSTLDDLALSTVDHEELIREFKETARTSYGSPASFDNVSFIAAFLKMAKGFEGSLPIHYPRAKRPSDPHPDGQNFEWFVANDRTGQNGGPQASLPDLATDLGLPMLDAP